MPHEEVADADRASVEGRAVPSERNPLDRDRIVVAAIGFIDAHGLPSLSMRRLGGVLGVEAMSLYRYVPGRENLLDAVVERIVDEMRDDPEVLDAAPGRLAGLPAAAGPRRPPHGARPSQGLPAGRLAAPRGAVVAAAAAEPDLGGGVPRRADRGGLPRRRTAVAAYRSFTSFLLGHLLLEVAALGADVGPLDVLDDSEDANDKSIAPYPTVRRLRSALAEDHAAAEFEEALEGLLDRIALLRAEES